MVVCGIVLGAIFVPGTYAQDKPYFIDGYHGGIFGHYPLWNTQFYVDNLAKKPEWQINLEIEPETWDVVKQKTPEAYKAFQKIAAGEKIEFVNPTVAQPYMYNVSGESIIRQMEHGMDWIHKHFPDVEFVTYSSEEPCFTSALPQILVSFGYKYASLKCPNTCWGGYTSAYGGQLVNWVGPDGTSILTVPRYESESLGKEDVWTTIAKDNSDEYLEACRKQGIVNPVGMCLQDAGWNGGPWIGSGDNIRNNSTYQTWRNYFEDVTLGKTDDDWHFSQENVHPGLMWGSQVLQVISQQVRDSENNIIMAEKTNAMNIIDGNPAVGDAKFRKAWRDLSMSQHHDSWIVPYNGLVPGTTWAEAIGHWTKNTDKLSKEIIDGFFDHNDNGNVIKIVNTSSTSRSELVKVQLPIEYIWKGFSIQDENGKDAPFYKLLKEGNTIVQFNAAVPAFGYTYYNIKNAAISDNSTEKVCAYYFNEDYSKFSVETDVYTLTFDLKKGGVASSLYSKKYKKELIDGSANFNFSELRGFFYDKGRFISNTESTASVNIVENTPWGITVEVKSSLDGTPVIQTYTLINGQERIDCKLRIDWKEDVGIGEFKTDNAWNTNRRPSYNDKYKLLLHLPTTFAGDNFTVYKDAPFDVCESQLDNTLYSTWDSIKHNVMLRWVDFYNPTNDKGFAIMTDHMTSYVHGEDIPPSLNVQYSGKGLWNVDYRITGPTEIEYALLFHENKWDEVGLWSKAVEYNEPLITGVETQNKNKVTEKSYVSIGKKGYEISTIEVKDGELYLRVFNAEADGSEVSINLNFNASKVSEVNLLGDKVSDINLIKNGGKSTVTTKMPRFGFKTFKITI